MQPHLSHSLLTAKLGNGWCSSHFTVEYEKALTMACVTSLSLNVKQMKGERVLRKLKHLAQISQEQTSELQIEVVLPSLSIVFLV